MQTCTLMKIGVFSNVFFYTQSQERMGDTTDSLTAQYKNVQKTLTFTLSFFELRRYNTQYKKIRKERFFIHEFKSDTEIC